MMGWYQESLFVIDILDFSITISEQIHISPSYLIEIISLGRGLGGEWSK